jgi:hypothetical protein
VRGLGALGILNGDVFGNIWALTWVSRHISTPGRLFAANIYYPDPASLAFTESLLAQSFVAAPLLALGASPVAAYNVVWLTTFPLSGLGAYLLARRLSGPGLGAFLAGVAYAFSAYHIDSAVHLQTLSIQWLPFAVLFLLRALAAPTAANLLGCGAFTLLQALSSGYYAALLPPVFGVVLLFHAPRAGRRAVTRLVVMLAVTAVAAAPAFLPYWRAQQRLHLARTPRELTAWSATWGSYLRPSGQALSPTLSPLRRLVRDGPALYPGTAALALAAVGIVARRRATPFLVALAATGALLSFGPEIRLGGLVLPGPYEAIRALPGYRLLRTPYRMAPAALLAIACLSALGWGALAERSVAFRRWGFVLILLAVGEGAAVGTSRLFVPLPAPPPVALWLASAPRAPVLEIPWDTYDGVYAFWSITHGQRTVNGWGAFAPPQSIRLGIWGRRWPGPGAARVLRGAGVRYVVAHVARLPPQQRAWLLGAKALPPGVSLAAELGDDRAYTISPEGPQDPPPDEMPASGGP